MLRLFTACAVASGLALAIATPALAQKGGSGHATGGTTMTQGGGQTMDRDRDDRVNRNSNGTNVIDRDKGLGRAQDRNQAQTPNRNSNGVNAIDRDKGLDRAQDRRNQAQVPNRNSNGVNAIDRDKGLGRAEDRRNDHDADDLKR